MSKETVARRETTTIQTWPGGASFEYCGDPEGPANQKELRTGYSRDGAPWRPGTEDEWRLIRIAERAEMYARRDIRGCVSALIDDLIKAASSGELPGDLGEAFSYDAIRNVYADTSTWGLEQCRDYINDYGGADAEPTEGNVWQMDRADLVEQLENVGIECRDDESDETLRAAVIANIDDETIPGLDDWRNAARELAEDNPQEPYEWYAVDGWLCDQLHEIGEVTIDNGYGRYWGRTCTGQMLIMDGTLQQIAARFEK